MDNDPLFDAPRPDLWSGWSRLRILWLILLLGAGNFFFQSLVFLVSGGLFLPVVAGAVLGVLVPLGIIFRRGGLSPQRDLLLGPVPPSVLLITLLMAAAAIPPTSLLAELSLRLHPPDARWIKFFSDNLENTPAQIALAAVGGVILAPLVEEIIFRGLLQRLLTRTWGPWPGILISSLIFGLVHGEPWFLFGLIGVGLVLGFLFEATGSLSACWAAHALHNAVSLVILFARQDTSLQPTPLHLADWLLAAGSLAVVAGLGWWLWRSRGDASIGAF